MEGMRFLTINALVQYGQKLYDRGDLDEACAVFNHVLTYDGHQVQALEYLKKMGHSPILIVTPIVQTKVFAPAAVAGKVNLAVEKPAISTVDVSDTEDLKKAIEAKKQNVEKLRAQIMQMQMNIASETTKE
jgi:TolA-binding protein